MYIIQNNFKKRIYSTKHALIGPNSEQNFVRLSCFKKSYLNFFPEVPLTSTLQFFRTVCLSLSLVSCFAKFYIFGKK